MTLFISFSVSLSTKCSDIRFTADTENKSIEQILSEAKELINDSLTVADCASILSTDDVSSVYSTDDVTFINIEDSNDTDEVNGNYDVRDKTTVLPRETLKLDTSDLNNGEFALGFKVLVVRGFHWKKHGVSSTITRVN